MQAEFSRIVNLGELSRTGAVFDIAADAGERRALALRFGLEAIEELSARVKLRRSGRETVLLSARVQAVVVQTCVVTLEPVRNRIDETVEIRFGRGAASPGADAGGVVVVSPEDSEPLEGDILDIGEVVAEELALSLDPFPRAADAPETLGPDAGGDGTDAPASPFGALAGLRRRD